MIDSRNDVQKFFGMYRGVVQGHSNKPSFCKIFVPGVYPDELSAAECLPDAEQASPLFGPCEKGSGLISTPHIGSYVWVFFQNGDQNYPVYFASIPAGDVFGQNFAQNCKAGAKADLKLDDPNTLSVEQSEQQKKEQQAADTIGQNALSSIEDNDKKYQIDLDLLEYARDGEFNIEVLQELRFQADEVSEDSEDFQVTSNIVRQIDALLSSGEENSSMYESFRQYLVTILREDEPLDEFIPPNRGHEKDNDNYHNSQYTIQVYTSAVKMFENGKIQITTLPAQMSYDNDDNDLSSDLSSINAMSQCLSSEITLDTTSGGGKITLRANVIELDANEIIFKPKRKLEVKDVQNVLVDVNGRTNVTSPAMKFDCKDSFMLDATQAVVKYNGRFTRIGPQQCQTN